MYWLISLMTVALLGLVLTGVYLEFRPAASARARPWHRPVIAGNLGLFVIAQAAMMIFGAQEVLVVRAMTHVALQARARLVGVRRDAATPRGLPAR